MNGFGADPKEYRREQRVKFKPTIFRRDFLSLPPLAPHRASADDSHSATARPQIMSHDIEYSEKYADDDYEYRCGAPGLPPHLRRQPASSGPVGAGARLCLAARLCPT